LIAQLARIESQRLQHLLARFLGSERMRTGFEVLWTEAMPVAAGVQPARRAPPAVEALGIELRPDRVDRLPDGRMLVIDYKTGRAPPSARDLWGPRPRSPQLPLYATLAGADGIAMARLTAGPVTWLGVGAGSWDIPGVTDPAEFTGDEVPDWSTLRAQWWSALGRIGAEFLEGSFSVDRWHLEEAAGQWAMATRVYELDAADAEASDA
jgi:hypothetical protein